MNILQVFRAPVGGLFRHVVDLVRGQIARGHNVGIICDTYTRNAYADAVLLELAPKLALGLTRIAMPRPLNPLDASAIWHVSQRIRETDADVVHGHGGKGGAYARLAWANKKVVRAYTPHGGSLLLDHNSLRGKMYLTLERALMRQGDLFLFESAYSGEIFKRKIGEPQGIVRVTHNGVARSEFEPVTLADDATDLVFIGEFRPVKGIDILIDAIADLHRNNRPVTATLVGDGPDKAALMTQAENLGLMKAIRFMPAMSARRALSLGRVMVIPSRGESLPYVVLETAAAGKPLITTRVGGIPEIFGPLSGALIPAADTQALVQAIASTLDDSDRARDMANTLRYRVAAGFSVDSMVDGILAAYRDAIGATSSVHEPVLAGK